MKNATALIGMLLMGAALPGQTAAEAEPFDHWVGRVDIGGTIPEDVDLKELGDPVSGERFKLDPGFQFDMSLGYRPMPWLEVAPELGFTLNSVDSIGRWSYHETMLGQILMMANVRLEYPVKPRLAPFIGGGVGGVASLLTFGGYFSPYNYDYHDQEPEGTASDLALAFQAFGGLRYRVEEKCSLGLEYRFLFTDPQRWDVDWRNGSDFKVSIDSLRMHSICLVLSLEF